MFKKLSIFACSLSLVACMGPGTEDKPSSSSGSMSSSSSSSSSGNQEPQKSLYEKGKELYYQADMLCSTCHGADGMGIPGRANDPFQGCDKADRTMGVCGSVTGLETVIDRDMPSGVPSKCEGECATALAVFIAQEFIKLDNTSVACDGSINKGSKARRLNKMELAHTVNDVFGTGGEIFMDLPTDGTLKGFATAGSNLQTPTDWTKAYVEAATDVASAIVDNNGFKPNCANDNIQCAVDALANVGSKLFRSELSNEEKTQIRDSVDSVTGEADFNEGLKAGVLSLLLNPRFLFVLPDDKRLAAREMSSHEIADRLALALTGSLPDQQLLNQAGKDALRGAALEAEIDRLVDSEKFDRFIEMYSGGWFGLNDAGTKLEAELVGMTSQDWNSLLSDMKTETRMFLRHIIKNNRPIDEVLLADYSFLNKRLADHYGISGVNTDNNTFIKVDLPAGSGRTGLLTQGAMLANGIHRDTLSYIDRGKTVISAATCEELRVNPDLQAAVDAQVMGNETEKDKIQLRATSASCSGCHSKIDPIGWVFTEFGILGDKTTQDPDGDPLDTSGVLFGESFNNAAGLAKIIVDQGTLASCFASKYLTYSVGRSVDFNQSKEDKCAIEGSIQAARAVDGSIGVRDLLKSLATGKISTYSGTIIE